MRSFLTPEHGELIEAGGAVSERIADRAESEIVAVPVGSFTDYAAVCWRHQWAGAIVPSHVIAAQSLCPHCLVARDREEGRARYARVVRARDEAVLSRVGGAV